MAIISYHARPINALGSLLNLLNPPRLDKKTIKNSFNRSALGYNNAAVLQHEVLNRLSERLDYINLTPSTVLDIGCGTGKGIKRLSKHYSKAKIIGFDLAFNMLIQSKKEFGLFNKARLINADMEILPLKNESIDLIFSNLAIQWVNDLELTLLEFKRTGRPNGLLMFTTFGPNTLWELNDSWRQLDETPHVHRFIDMHDIGDLLVRCGFAEPVMDSETITMQYPTFKDVLIDLKNIGANNADKQRSKGLMTPSKFKLLESEYKKIGFKDNQYHASFEIIYGHAWL